MERLGLWMAILSLGGLVTLGSIEMTLRAFFETGLSISLEYSGYLVAIAFLGGSGWTLSEGGHIRVQILESWLSKKRRRSVRLFTAAISLVTAIVLIGGLITWTAGSFARGTVSFYPSATPLWWPQAFLSLAALILGLSLLGDLLRIWQGQEQVKPGPEIAP
jgi:TRAP-type C4-dicarboxylate transport system permease small subunit